MGNGGSGILNYSINGGVEQASGEFLNLLGGEYDVQIVDDSSCVKDTSVVILMPSKVVFDQAIIADVTGCNGDSNGSLDVNAAGGTGIKEYSLDAVTFQPSNIFSGLSAGDYTVTAQDTKFCTGDTLVTIIEPGPITYISESATDADCNGASTGSVNVEASGGTLPYTYALVLMEIL